MTNATNDTKTYTITVSSYSNRARKHSISMVDHTGRTIGNRVVSTVEGLLRATRTYEKVCSTVGADINYRAARVNR